jgi:ankyrin repeat protein
MANGPGHPLTASDVLRRYREEELPEFSEIVLEGVNQIGIFGNRPIHVAATRGSVEELIALIQSGADVNAVGEHGSTPLHDAVGQQKLEAVKVLLNHGALPTSKDEWGSTPFDIAMMHGRNDIADLLK